VLISLFDAIFSSIIMILKLRHPFRMIISGCSHSGKSYFTSEIIRGGSETIDKPPDIVIYCARYKSSVPNSIKHIVQFHQGLPDDDIFEKFNDKRVLVVLDDMQIDALRSDVTTNIFLFGRHSNISVIFMLHNIFPREKNARNISLNANYLVLLKNTRDPSQILTLSRQLQPLEPKFLSKVYFNFVNKPYSHILIDLNVDTEEYFKYRGNIFSNFQEIYLNERQLEMLENK